MTPNDYLYATWRAMRRRCFDTNYHSYQRYGGRGIKIDPRWQSWEGFKRTRPIGWEIGLTLDRIDVDGDYSPENCRWLPKHLNVKSLLVDPQKLLQEYKAGALQKQLAEKYNTDQPHISRILKKARQHHGRTA